MQTLADKLLTHYYHQYHCYLDQHFSTYLLNVDGAIIQWRKI